MHRREPGLDLLRCLARGPDFASFWHSAPTAVMAGIWHTPSQYLKLFLCVTPPIFILSILGGSLLQWLVGKFISFQKEAVP